MKKICKKFLEFCNLSFSKGLVIGSYITSIGGELLRYIEGEKFDLLGLVIGTILVIVFIILVKIIENRLNNNKQKK